MQAVFFIANPKAGRGRARTWLQHAHHACESLAFSYQLRETTGPGHAWELAHEAVLGSWPVVAVLGGDGTIHEVANALAGTDTMMAIFPCGRGNDLARYLGIPRQFDQAFDLLLHGASQTLDLGKTPDRYFVNIAGLGFSAEVVQRARTIRLGRLAFPLAVYQGLRNLVPYSLEVHLDGEPLLIEAISFHVNNHPYSGGGMVFAPEARPDDGMLDMNWVEPLAPWQFARTFPKMYRPQGVRHPAMHRRRAHTIEVRSPVPLPTMFDGELYGNTPLHIEVAPASLRVLVPDREDTSS